MSATGPTECRSVPTVHLKSAMPRQTYCVGTIRTVTGNWRDEGSGERPSQ